MSTDPPTSRKPRPGGRNGRSSAPHKRGTVSNKKSASAKRLNNLPPRKNSAPKFKPFTDAQIASRQADLPAITYPQALPVSARRNEIAAAIKTNQVVIIAGETGSGKTTQLPKICLELGRGASALIGHTQPRRIAARAVAQRIASELGTELGATIGYQVRFNDVVGPKTMVKLMTDGILLAEIQNDPDLLRYDTLIIDEAHERSLNIDFILGYLARLLPRRPDLKIIITSATIDVERFAAHFGQYVPGPRSENTLLSPAPIIEVSGRTYPVEIRYRPLAESSPEQVEDLGIVSPPGERNFERVTPASREKEKDQVTGIIEACEELTFAGDGDILVFLAGERDIRDTAAALSEHFRGRAFTGPAAPPPAHDPIEIVPLFARLSTQEQQRIFTPHSTRRIVLATNVAETSITVPGIRYVVDPGLARISRFSNRTKVQRLPIEEISQASANQRAGRCGRLADGITIRLYSEENFEARPQFTEPEILRTSLASVILQMTALGLGTIADFPFIDPPQARAVRDGIQLLVEIGALIPQSAQSPAPKLTKIGWSLSRLPIDPRLARMLIEAQRNGCASEVAIIVGALSIQDVRERPVEFQENADTAHARFIDQHSDFITYLNLWRYLRTQIRDLSGSGLRRMCRREFLHYLRIREWQDIVSQLRDMARPLGITMGPLDRPTRAQIAAEEESGGIADATARACVKLTLSPTTTDADAIHKSLLVGLLSNLGSWDEKNREYTGARGTRFTVWPGSGLARRRYDWVMSAELVETSRLFARTVARINPDWVEPLAGHLVKKVYSDPYWSTRNGAAMIREKVLLYGMTLIADRSVLLGRLRDFEFGPLSGPQLARDMFIRSALVEGNWRTHHRFYRRNKELYAQAAREEDRQRTRGLLASDEDIFSFYDALLPEEIISAAHFDSWWRKAERENPDLLTFTPQVLLPRGQNRAGFPTHWVQGDLRLPLSYVFAPHKSDDGITVTVPIEVLSRLEETGFDWLVPAMVPQLCVGTIKALPKRIRKLLAPAPDTAEKLTKRFTNWSSSLAVCDGGVSSVNAITNSGSISSPGSTNTDISPGRDANQEALAASFDRLSAWAHGSGITRKKPMSAQTTHSQPTPTKIPTPSKQDFVDTENRPLGGLENCVENPFPHGKSIPAWEAGISFSQAFTIGVRELIGISLTAQDWETVSTDLADHLRIRFKVVDGSRQILGTGRSLPYLQRTLAPKANAAIRQAVKGAVAVALADAQRKTGKNISSATAAAKIAKTVSRKTSTTLEKSYLSQKQQALSPAAGTDKKEGPLALTEILGLTSWPNLSTPGDEIPFQLQTRGSHSMMVRGYPALRAEGRGTAAQVALRILADNASAQNAHHQGLSLLALQATRLPLKRVTTRWTGKEAALLASSPYISTAELVEDAQQAAARIVVQNFLTLPAAPKQIRNREAFSQLVAYMRQNLEEEIYTVLKCAVAAFAANAELQKLLGQSMPITLAHVANEVRTQAHTLLKAGFLTDTPATQLPHLARFIRAKTVRLTRAQQDTARDDRLAWEFERVQTAISDAKDLAANLPFDLSRAQAISAAIWLSEELRVSLFAQQLGTPIKVSVKRVLAALA